MSATATTATTDPIYGTELVHYEVKEHIATITLDHAPANAFSYALSRQFVDAFTRADRDDDVRVIILRAEGRIFSGGHDLKESKNPPVIPEGEISSKELGPKTFPQPAIVSKPVITLVQGWAVGGAFCVVAYSDIVIASPEAKFSVPEVKIGAVGGTGGAAWALPNHIASYLALTGAPIDAERAYQVGFVNEIVPKDKLVEEGERVAKLILANPPITVKYIKQSLRDIYPLSRITEPVRINASRNDVALNTEDAREAVAAFVEKRQPVFHGR